MTPSISARVAWACIRISMAAMVAAHRQAPSIPRAQPLTIGAP
jgi:hypothetical protein